MITTLNQLRFDNRFVAQLPADATMAGSPRQVLDACYSLVDPTPVKGATLIAYSPEAAEQLGFSSALCQSQDFAETFVGNQIITGMQPFAMCYGGHQFGHWAGQLGDGRAINLGEMLIAKGERLTLQLKGAGPTPYSRTADGLAVLRSSIREFLCSEAMYHLGVPTTRALSVVLTGEKVIRDMFYDGNQQYEPTAVVCRVAPSFTRFGNFQLQASRGNTELLKQLVDFTITNDFPQLLEQGQSLDKDTYLMWFKTISETTAKMVAHWMRVGFVHGVMNTDNMSILGLTIDYGPYGWLEGYDPTWTPNTTDAQGKRYSYRNQPQMAHWNLLQLGNALLPLIEDAAPLEQILRDFVGDYHHLWHNMLATKVGLPDYNEAHDSAPLEELLELLAVVETDMTIFFRQLANLEQHRSYSDAQLLAVIEAAYYQPDQLDDEYKTRMLSWLNDYQQRLTTLDTSDEQRKTRMNLVNPKYVMRNYLAQQAIDKAHQEDYSLVEKLLEVMKKPYDEQPENEIFAAKRPEWARVKAGCSMLSCSS
ncbi:MAG: hypothetical protein ACI9FJ_001223 [Alteromonadaceae bacterium]|jgi:uncharacterized protein YdiU (UPF0061 family)